MPKPDCLGLLFLHTDHHCVGGKGRAACADAAECATLCDRRATIAGEVPSWSELNLACVAVECQTPRRDLSLIQTVLPTKGTTRSYDGRASDGD